jgi:hypothetical protein
LSLLRARTMAVGDLPRLCGWRCSRHRHGTHGQGRSDKKRATHGDFLQVLGVVESVWCL